MPPTLQNLEREFVRNRAFQEQSPYEQMKGYQAWASANKPGYASLTPFDKSTQAKQSLESLSPSTAFKIAEWIPILGPTLSAASSKAESPSMISNIDSALGRSLIALGAEAVMMFGAVKAGQAVRGLVSQLPKVQAAFAITGVTPTGVALTSEQALAAGAKASTSTAVETVLGGIGETATDAAIFTLGSSILHETPPDIEHLVANAGFIGAVKLGVFGGKALAGKSADYQVGQALRQQTQNPDILLSSNEAGKVARKYQEMFKVSQQDAGDAVVKAVEGNYTDEISRNIRQVLTQNPRLLGTKFGRVLTRQLLPSLHPNSVVTEKGGIRISYEQLKDPNSGEILTKGFTRHDQMVDHAGMQELINDHQVGKIHIQKMFGPQKAVDEFNHLLPKPGPMLVNPGLSSNPNIQPYIEQAWDEALGRKPLTSPAPLFQEAPGTAMLGQDTRGKISADNGVSGIKSQMQSGEIFQIRRDPKGGFAAIPPQLKTDLLDRESVFTFGDGKGDSVLISHPIKTHTGEMIVRVEEWPSRASEIVQAEDFFRYIEEGSLKFEAQVQGPKIPLRLLGARAKLGIETRRVIDLQQTKDLLASQSTAPILAGKESLLPLEDPVATLAYGLGGKAYKVGDGVRLKFDQVQQSYATPVEAFGALRRLQDIRLEESRMIALSEQSIRENRWPKLPAPITTRDLSPTLHMDEFWEGKAAGKEDTGRWMNGRAVPKYGPILDAASKAALAGQNGLSFYAHLKDYIDITDSTYGNPANELDQLLRSLSTDDIRVFHDHVQGGGPISPNGQRVAQRIHELQTSLYREEAKLGIPIPRDLSRPVWPTIWDQTELNKAHPKFTAVVPSMAQDLNITQQDASLMFDEWVRDRTYRLTATAKHGGQDLSSLRDHLPGYSKDPRLSYMIWFQKHARRIAEAKVFGVKDEKLNELVEKLDSQGLKPWAQGLADAILGKNQEEFHPFLKAAYDFQAIKLFFAGIPNLLGQHLNPAFRVGMQKTYQGWFKFLRDPGPSGTYASQARSIGALSVKGQERLERDGMWSMFGKGLWDREEFSWKGTLGNAKEKLEKISGFSLAATEAWLRSTATEIGRGDVAELLLKAEDVISGKLVGKEADKIWERLAEYRLGENHIRKMLLRGDADERYIVELLGGKRLSDHANFKYNVLTLPSGAFESAPKLLSSPVGKTFLQYKSFMLGQTRFAFDELFAGVRNGDWKRTARWVSLLSMAFPAAGLAAQSLTGALKGNPDMLNDVQELFEDPDAVKAMSLMTVGMTGAGAFGIAQELAVDAISRDEFRLKGLLNPPMVQTGYNALMFLSASGGALLGDSESLDEANRRVLRELGPVGRLVENVGMGKNRRAR